MYLTFTPWIDIMIKGFFLVIIAYAFGARKWEVLGFAIVALLTMYIIEYNDDD